MTEIIFSHENSTEMRYSLMNRRLRIAGWTGRDAASVRAHIDELKALGVSPPARTPQIYNVSVSLLTTAGHIEVLGNKTSGEAEFVLFSHHEKIWVGIGSDHTCRELEVSSVPASKQVCAKPIGNTVWLLDDLLPHWDELELRSYIERSGRRELYQSSKVHGILPPAALLALCATEGIDLNNSVLFCGTVPLVMPWTDADVFICELHDPVMNRSIQCKYEIQTLN